MGWSILRPEKCVRRPRRHHCSPFSIYFWCRQGRAMTVELLNGDLLCLVTTDTSVSLTIARLTSLKDCFSRELIRPYILQMASVKTFPILKEKFVELALGRNLLRTFVILIKITDKFILRWVYWPITMHAWIWDAVFYNWAKKCHCDALERYHVLSFIRRLAAR